MSVGAITATVVPADEEGARTLGLAEVVALKGFAAAFHDSWSPDLTPDDDTRCAYRSPCSARRSHCGSPTSRKPLASMILEGRIREGQTVHVTAGDRGLIIDGVEAAAANNSQPGVRIQLLTSPSCPTNSAAAVAVAPVRERERAARTGSHWASRGTK